MNLRTRLLPFLFTFCLVSAPGVYAHHSPLLYDGKTEVTFSGVVKTAKYGFPHSRYTITVTNEDGSKLDWLMSTEDPKDAKELGFDEAIKNLKPGDKITVIGWPHRHNKNEVRGHRLIYEDGHEVMLRRGNYFRPPVLRQLDAYLREPTTINADITVVDPGLPVTERIVLWAEVDNAIPRAANEIVQNRERLIGIDTGETILYPGVREHLLCQTEEADAVEKFNFSSTDTAKRQTLEDYISRYNRLISGYWETKRNSCGN